MKKTKLLLYICLAMFLLNSCTEEKEYLENNNPSRYKIKDYTFKEANRIAKFSKVSSRMGKNFSKLNTLRNASAREGDTDFVIDESVVKEISIDDYTSYTMKILREEPSTTYFENLVIELKNDSTYAYIIKYTPTDGMESLDEHMHDFEGTIEASKYGITSLTGNGGSNNLGTSDGSNATSSNTEEPNYGGGGYSVEDCVTIMLCNYVPIGSPLSNPHIAYGSQCQPYPVTSCSSTGWGTTTLGTNPTGTGPSGGQMGSGTNTATEDTSNPITVPIVPLPKSTPCEELKKMTDNLAIRNSYTNPSTGLNSKVYQNIEFGNAFSKNEDGTDSCAPLSNDSANPSQLSISVGGNNYGMNHTHPDASTTAVYPMFGPPNDIDYLYRVSLKSTIFPKDYSIFVITLTVPDGTFALKIEDVTKFYSFKNNEKKYNKAMKDLVDLYEECGIYNMSCLTKALLFIFKDNDAGVGLYKAESDFSNWNKLSLSPHDLVNPNTFNPNSSTNPIVNTPCK